MRDKTADLTDVQKACLLEVTGEQDLAKAYARLAADGALVERHAQLVAERGEVKEPKAKEPKKPTK